MVNEFVKERIVNLHNTKNISARALSLELGKSSEYLNQVENGKLNPPVEFLSDFCDYFGVTLSEFFDENYSHPVQMKELIKEAGKLSKDEFEQVLQLVKTINKNKE